MRWQRYLGGTLIFVSVVVTALFLVAVHVVYTAHTIGDAYANRSAPDHTAAACLESEGCGVANLAESAPIGGLAEYRRCGGIISAARIKGQPLACSEQWATDLLLRSWFTPGQSAYRQLRRGCRKHDLCYVHGRATFGANRIQCDQEFLAENLRECWMIYNSEARVDWEAERISESFAQKERVRKPWYTRWLGVNRDAFRKACQARAAVAYLAVRVGGEDLFERHEGVNCEYEGGPHAARDQVATGRFLGGDRDYVISLSLTRKQNTLTVRLLSFGPDGQSRDEAETLVMSANSVAVGDREWTCSWRHKTDGSYREDCPEWLGPAAFTNAAEWLRFAPIVVDSDGDGIDELVIPSLVPQFGLVFTHIRTVREGDAVRFDEPLAYLGVARMERAGTEEGECEFEFADCQETGSPPKLLSSEAADQNAGYQFTVAKGADAGCLPTGNPNVQDILLMSAFSDFPKNPNPEISKIGGWDSDYVLRRFTFEPQSKRWHMRRDRFNNDWHRMAGCSIRESRDQFQTHSRLQYPPLVVRVPPVPETKLNPDNPPACAYEERLALVSRDKCPTSTPVARAGGLNDVDLMLYRLEPKEKYDLASDAEQRKRYPRGDHDDLRLAEVHWKPILLPETADPAVTSRAAREHGIVMVGAYIGGTRLIGRGADDIRRVGHHPVIAVVRTEQILPLNRKGFDRYADTIGRVPDLYGVFKSSSYGATSSEKVSNLWDPKRFGPASIYFQIPSVLTSFDAIGGEGVSLVFFSNSALWAGSPPPKEPGWYDALSSYMTELLGYEPLSKHLSEPLPINEGTFRLMIIPIWFQDSNKEWAHSPGMFDCPVSAIADASAKPAPGIADDPNFLRNQPILAGRFFDADAGGSLAVTWRDEKGDVRLTALRFEEGKWKFGGKECSRPAGMADNELFRLRIN